MKYAMRRFGAASMEAEIVEPTIVESGSEHQVVKLPFIWLTSGLRRLVFAERIAISANFTQVKRFQVALDSSCHINVLCQEAASQAILRASASD